MSKININTRAIPISVKDINGNLIQLEEYEGKKVVLSFYRKAACPFCNLGIQSLIKNYDQLQEKGIHIIAFFSSTEEDIRKYAGKQNAPFPIIADPDYKIYNQYGVGSSVGGMMKTFLHPGKVLKSMRSGFFSLKPVFEKPMMPADFLIGENMEIQQIHYGTTFDDHLPIEVIMNF